jgi:branched-chain amino acid transport system substrate-binding protein
MNNATMSHKLMAVLGLFALSFSSFAREVKVGVVFPSTGSYATLGTDSLRGLQLAQEKLGKDLTKDIKLFIEDDKSDPIEATNATRKLINVDKVEVIIGESTSSNTLAMAPIAQEAKIPAISRACFTDDFQGVVMAKFAMNTLKKKNGLVIIDNSSDYSKGLAKSFKEEYQRLGGKYASTDELTYVQKDTDFQSLLRKVKRANPDFIFLPGYYNEVGLIIKQARALGINIPFLGGDGWDSPELFTIAGEAIKGNYISSHFAPDDKDPKVQAFVKDYEKKFGVKPGSFSALGFDAYAIVANAIKVSKTGKAVDINKAIVGTKNFQGITGTISMDENRNSKKAAVVLETTTQGFVFKNKVNP